MPVNEATQLKATVKEVQMASPRIRRVNSRRELETVRDDFITQGYEVLNEGETSLLMRKSTWGSTGTHVVIGLFTIWWTIGIGNLIYAVVAHSGADQVMLKLELPDAAQPLAGATALTPDAGLAGA
jgi:hypothetical protein